MTGPRRDDPSDHRVRRALADRITEDVLQLLYTAHQDVAEIQLRGAAPGAPVAQSAQECTLGAISILRVVASTVLTAAWGPSENAGAEDGWERTSAVLVDALADAWVLTCADTDLLFASEPARRLLDCTLEELSALLRDKDGWPRRLAATPKTRGMSGEDHFDLEIGLKDGSRRFLHVERHALPQAPGVKQSYISLLTEHDR